MFRWTLLLQNFGWACGLCILLLSCTDYQIGKVQEPEAPGVAPDIVVDPLAIDLGVLCAEESATVSVGNQGDGDLSISAVLLQGEGWQWATEPSLPLVLAPGEWTTLALVAGAGSATVRILSDDADTPDISVPLSAAADAPPTLVLDTPFADGAFPIGAQTELVGWVTDPNVDPTTLTIVWSSDREGELGTATPDADGRFVYSWQAHAHRPGPHAISAQVVDSCGHTAEDAVEICQEAGYVADGLDLATWHMEGTAMWDVAENAVELTSLDQFAVGTAFQTIAAVPADAVSIQFAFQTGGGTGADGFSITALDVDRMTGFMGAPGCALGYGEAHESCIDTGEALPGWSIEVDTYYNPYIDPSSNDHLSLTFDGDLDTVAAWSDLDEVEDTGWHTIQIDVDAPHITVWMDDSVLVDADIPSFYAFDAYIGFTAATGGDTNEHTIAALEVTGKTCEAWSPEAE